MVFQEEEDSLSLGLETTSGLEDEDDKKASVLSFEDLQRATDVSIRVPDGVEVMIMNSVRAEDGRGGGRGSFMLQQNLGFAKPSPFRGSGFSYMVTPMVIAPPYQIMCTSQRLESGGFLFSPQIQVRGKHDTNVFAVVFPPTASNPMAPSGLATVGGEWKGRGADFALDVGTRLDARKGDEHTVDYFQGVSKNVALGGRVQFKNEAFLSSPIHTVLWGLTGSWMSDSGDKTFTARYDLSEDTLFTARYHREIREKAKVAAEITVTEDMESRTSLAVELPLRYEPTLAPGPYTTLKTGVDNTGELLFGVEHVIGSGAESLGKLELVSKMNHFTEDYKFGVHYSFQS